MGLLPDRLFGIVQVKIRFLVLDIASNFEKRAQKC